MRNLLLALVFVAITACEDDVLLPKAAPVVRKTVLARPTVTMPRVDTTKASSICKASVRAGRRVVIRLDAETAETAAVQLRRRAAAYATLITNTCN